MKIILFPALPATLAAAALLFGVSLHAQTTDSSAMPNSMPPPAPGVMSAPAQTPYPQLQVDVGAVYAFRMRTTGFTGDIGGMILPRQFLGFEYTYLNPRGTSFDPVAGPIQSRENISSFEAAYRYSMPLTMGSNNGWSPLRFYVGGSAGVSTVRLRSSVSRFGFSTTDEDNGVFTAEGNVGFAWDLNRNWGVKAGYRYIYLRNVSLYGQRANIDTGGIEYALSFRW